MRGASLSTRINIFSWRRMQRVARLVFQTTLESSSLSDAAKVGVRLSALVGSGDALPHSTVHVGCSSMAERLAVNEETTSSILASRPKLFRNCGRDVRHLIVDQADDGSSPFSSAMLASVAKRIKAPAS